MEPETTVLTLLVESTQIVAEVFGVFGVALMVIGISVATLLSLPGLLTAGARTEALQIYKIRIGRAMLLGLEILIAADIVKTVALEPTIANISALGLLVLVRTFLSWALSLEIEGHWPWQRKGSQQD